MKGKEDALATINMVPGESVYGEKRVSVNDDSGTAVEYRVWNPFRSKLAAAMMGGLENVHIQPGSKLLYLGAASGTTVSHCSDLVGPVSLFYFIGSIKALFLKTLHIFSRKELFMLLNFLIAQAVTSLM